MFKKITLIFLLISSLLLDSNILFAANEEPVYTQLRVVDKGTFNEYRYKITDKFFSLRNKYELDWKIDTNIASNILELAKKGYLYLPDNLSNKNYYNYLKTSIEKGIKYPLNASNYTSIVKSIENYLDKTTIKSIKWKVEAFPREWNAPLNVTLRWSVRDPSWTKIPVYNYTWWMQVDGKRKVLWNGISLNHIFKDEWKFAIFLDVKSSHKNNWWYNDVLPFSSRVDINIKEKIASVLIKVNSTSLRNKNELKFTPDEARYGLLIDATSSTPTSGSVFLKTTWDFWNGIVKTYDGSPKIERVVYAREWEYNVVLTLKTNELKTIERKFKISVHDPIATIKASSEEWYLWDKFTFSAQKTWNDKNLSYSWEIVDLKEDKIIYKKAGTLFTYIFNNKWKYNVKMKVTEPSWQTDVDNKIIYINSRAPVAAFSSDIPYKFKPNTVFLDATKSYDPDYTDDWKLKYSWIIDWNRINLSNSNYNGSNWYYTFSSIWEHSITLEVEDPDKITSIKKWSVKINSILSVEFFVFPRVTQREKTIRFVSSSPEAQFYEWDFWDWIKKWWRDASISHSYKKSGIFNVRLQVRDIDDNVNSFEKNVYIWESDSPYAFMTVKDNSISNTPFDNTACNWKGAYVVNRVDSVRFSWIESININWENNWLSYSWKLGKDLYKNSKDFSKKFDELWCFPIKLTVKSLENWKTSSVTSFIEVKNLKPTLSSIDVQVVNPDTDPVIVNVTALWAKDRDGVIQSYLWYYYTDIDSEPQDFRATKWPNTSFVLPKVTWNYYFVVIMKDNNEEKSNSENLTGSKYFITLTWDNLNTPLVKLKINDSSISIWDEAIFTVNVENILWQDLTKKVKYSWDFDWDWFYDEETKTNIVSHRYLSSWEKHAKVKAKYKWFSNTKSVTVEVSNVLKPDFWYISIANKFIFFYNWIWDAKHYEWNLWDGTIIKDKKSFIHEYTDWKSSHLIILKVSEWTKVKILEKKIIKNVKNKIIAVKKWLVSFVYPKIIKDNKIILNRDTENVFVYLGESKWNIKHYVVDYDINYDSNLNWENDDDEDNKNLDSYNDWWVVKILLNKDKYQTFRVYIIDDKWTIINSKDYNIVKNYIKEQKININNIKFDWITDSTKLKIEKLKNYIDWLPKQYKLKGSMYIQKLQENWFDTREKTNVILEFEWFIVDTWVSNNEDIVNLLEWLLVENQVDKSDKAITYNALKNLIPQSIVCKNEKTLEETNCYDDLIKKLDAIKNNDNIDENKILGTEILKVIALDKVMTNKEKTDFKAILKTFIYWSVANIPADEKAEVNNQDNTNWVNLMDLIYSVFYWIAIIIFILLWFIVLFYFYYKITNKDSNIWFQDFIIEKTSWEKKVKTIVKDNFEDDLLADLEKEENKEESKTDEVKTKEEKKEIQIDSKKDVKEDKQVWSNEEVPDWLKWDFSEEVKDEAREEISKSNNITLINKWKVSWKSTNKKDDDNIPDWLKWSFSEEIEKKEIESDDLINDSINKWKVSWNSANKKDDDNIPDWLKWSFSEDTNKEELKTDEVKIKEENKEIKTDSKKVVNKKIVAKKEKVIENNWSKILAKKEKVETSKVKKTETKKSPIKKIVTKKSSVKKVDTKNDSTKKTLNNKVDNSTKEVNKKEVKKDLPKNKEEKTAELWDDWMKVPDWLKSDDDK